MKSTIAKKTEGYGYKYTELADINKYCEENEIRYYQEVETSEINQKDYIITYLIKEGKEEKHRGCQIVDAVLQGIKNPVQEYGSSLTYCRRYSLLMALGLATEDDDAQSISVEKEDKKATPKQVEVLKKYYVCNTTWNGYAFKVATIVESAPTNRCNAVGESDAFKATAIGESVISYSRHAIRHRETYIIFFWNNDLPWRYARFGQSCRIPETHGHNEAALC